ncbi:nucleoside hydrolase [Actinoplanes sp. TBRC 11911]|uniref:nucleoside hydrolase n=1 Tax=Actinoplanes sp. TBRC 11911 TaxID=2729386 RepID=UPI00145E6573|nr:nucleoside hydrolase [Actinoplanes sp. TBRC 11911]NMO55726.1 nucleoside hydrolase [Actinoplanes sp. TBRC 11911]
MLIYLDCDTGIDDALALAVLLARPDVTLAGVGTVDGNTTAVQAAANTLGLLALAGRSVPVSVGGGVFLGGSETVHGSNGVGGVSLPGGSVDPRPAPSLLVSLAAAHPGELHVVALGPCSNLAAALALSPSLASQVASVTVMGGAVRVPGNVSGRAEFNIANDAPAAAAVVAAGWPVTLVPLDLTMGCRWDASAIAALAADGRPLTTALSQIIPLYYDFYEEESGVREIPLHDPTAAALAVGLLTPSDAPVLGLRVDPSSGATIEDPSAATRARVVFEVEGRPGPAILETILAGDWPPST